MELFFRKSVGERFGERFCWVPFAVLLQLFSFSGDGEELPAEFRRDVDNLTVVSKCRNLKLLQICDFIKLSHFLFIFNMNLIGTLLLIWPSSFVFANKNASGQLIHELLVLKNKLIWIIYDIKWKYLIIYNYLEVVFIVGTTPSLDGDTISLDSLGVPARLIDGL